MNLRIDEAEAGVSAYPRRLARSATVLASPVLPIARRASARPSIASKNGRFATRSRGNRPEKPGGRALLPSSTA